MIYGKSRVRAALAGIALLGAAGCEEKDPTMERTEQTEEELIEEGRRAADEVTNSATNPFGEVESLVAVMHPTKGNDIKGVAHFREAPDGVEVVADLQGFEPGSKHGFHIHQYGDCSASDGTSAGGHYNPEDHEHALPSKTPRHAGDMGNIEADEQGEVHLEETFNNITLVSQENPILGRGVIVHAQEDDGSQPTGDAGPRVSCGVIGIAEMND